MYDYPITAEVVYDSDPQFVHAISLIATVSEMQADPTILQALAFVRLELSEDGERLEPHHVAVEVTDFETGLDDLEQRLTALLAGSEVLQHTLRTHAALELLREARREAAAATGGESQ